MHSRTILKLLKEDGWVQVQRTGSHVQLKHPAKPGRTTVPHPNPDIPIGTLKSIEKQSGVRLR
ncbi:type II toxin-antitoxin system HicA family toxin [Roseospira visakhapatnamensis]|uniref:Putative RNA binding protein YcfA (HicA-like mRNA interferase family) n=1 Tax=Roseospira visakhapatnamensis TaxID=390880 RepID=A0A7W6RGM4_9PROT|nr:type II toxin-antitoxin system HicA family toxin [Roseospira visakhapatnamensis]MBB4268209.1 putative RNA binding protein YcfA (HicA-like mRNA interferase family) [Roseospira visakhapatnamensis]